MNDNRKMILFDYDLSDAAMIHMREWINPPGSWERGEEGSPLLAVQQELISAGLMANHGVLPLTVFLTEQGQEYAKQIIEVMYKPPAPREASEIEKLVLTIKQAFPHFQNDEEVTPEIIRQIGKEYQTMAWASGPVEIEFYDGEKEKFRKIVYEQGDSEVGIPGGYVLKED